MPRLKGKKYTPLLYAYSPCLKQCHQFCKYIKRNKKIHLSLDNKKLLLNNLELQNPEKIKIV